MRLPIKQAAAAAALLAVLLPLTPTAASTASAINNPGHYVLTPSYGTGVSMYATDGSAKFCWTEDYSHGTVDYNDNQDWIGLANFSSAFDNFRGPDGDGHRYFSLGHNYGCYTISASLMTTIFNEQGYNIHFTIGYTGLSGDNHYMDDIMLNKNEWQTAKGETVDPPPTCTADQVGTYPDCQNKTCENQYGQGSPGEYPDCSCPTGNTGTPPNCTPDQTDPVPTEPTAITTRDQQLIALGLALFTAFWCIYAFRWHPK